AFQHFVEAREPAAILKWSVSFAPDVARIGHARLPGADIGHGEPMLPAIAKVLDVVDDGLSRLEHVAQAHFAGVNTGLGPPIVIHGQTVPLLADGGNRTIPSRPG